MRSVDFMPQNAIAEFHDRFLFPHRNEPTSGTLEERAFRLELLTEELGEVAKAFRRGDLEEIVQELADLVYVAYGSAVTFGFDLDHALEEVHRANMTKAPPVNGKPVKSGAFIPANKQRLVKPFKQGES